MTRLTDFLSQGLEQIRQKPALQHSWEFSLATSLSGFLLLGCRLLGSFQPDADSLRGLGILWLINGTILLGFWLLKEMASQQRLQHGHVAAWGLLLFSGAFWASLAIMPVQSVLPVLGGLFSLLILGGFLADQILFYRPEPTASSLSPADVASTSAPVTATQTTSQTTAPASPAAPVAGPSIAQTSPQNLVQWLSRRQEADGTEIVEGMVRLELASGQTQRSAHIAFAPSLPGVPEMECEPLGDAEVETILGDVYPHGFRVDVRRLSSQREAESVEVGFQAICHATGKSAA